MKRHLLAVMVVFALLVHGGILHASPVKIRMGWGIPAEEVKYVMMKRPQILKHYGKEYTIEWFQFSGTAPQATALAAGGLDGATLASLSLAESIDKIALDVKVTGGIIMEVVPNFTSTWLILENSGIKTVKDLKGKSVGVNVYGASLDHIQRAVLRKAGLDPEKDVKILEISFGLMEATLRRGDIQCGAFPQPFLFKAMEAGGVKPLFYLGDIQPKFVQLINVFQTKFIEKNPEVMKAFIDDWWLKYKLPLIDKVGGAFASGGGETGGKENVIYSLNLAMMNSGMILVGPLEDGFGQSGVSALDPVNDKALKECRDLGQRIASVAQRLKAATPAQISKSR